MKSYTCIFFIMFSSFTYAENPSEAIAKKQSDSELSIMGFTIGKSTLLDVQAKFKSKDIYKEGDAGSSTSLLCYKSSNGSIIAFESGEMGGESHIINSISIHSSSNPYRLSKICEKTSLIKTKLALNGISLGMSSDLITKLKGKPSKQSSNSILYHFEVQEKNGSASVDIMSDFNIELNQNAVSALSASKVESN
ncbi:MAG: hypothetical protein Q7U04_12815 [Bacteriovorax sp.]|nr:hypothetical protein [Bacteriovorax sp.]